MMMLALYVTVINLLLVQASTSDVKPDPSEISFEEFCKHFNDLRNGHNIRPVVQELEKIRVQLIQSGVLPEDRPSVTAANEICADESKFYNPECLYARRWEAILPNGDFIRTSDVRIRGFLVDLWLLHPVLRGCEVHLDEGSFHKDVKGKIAEGLSGDRPGDFANVFHKRSGRFIRNEIDKSCMKENRDEVFCESLPELVKLVDAYRVVERESKTSPEWNAFRIHFLALSHNNPDEFKDTKPKTPEEVNNLIINNLQEFFKLINSDQTNELSDLMSLVPDLTAIKSSCGTSLNGMTYTRKNECLFFKTIIQIRMYIASKSRSEGRVVTKILNTRNDYKTFLELTQMNRILQIVQDQQSALPDLFTWLNSEITKTVNERFKGLRTYFQEIESFNRDKARADIDFVNSRLTTFGQNIGTLRTDLGSKLDRLLKLAIAAVALEIAEDTVQVGLAAAVLMNPLEKLFGGSSAGDFMDRTAKLAQTLTKAGELARTKRSFDELTTKTIDISNKFNENAEFLENVKKLVDSLGTEESSEDFEAQKLKFMNSYTAYDPKVTKPELTAMAATWTELIESCCEVILSLETTLSQTVVANVRSSGICPKTKILAEEMIETYAEIYDFQFELIEAMATHMRALTALNAASSITGGYNELPAGSEPEDDAVLNLKVLGIVSYISYKINIWQVKEAYCDILEYKEGGRRPSVCEGAGTNVANLVSYEVQRCQEQVNFRDIPIKTAKSNDKSIININDLYNGKAITFKIPDKGWLVDKDWIASRDRDAAITVKKFEIFLPTMSNVRRRVIVEAKSTGLNQLSPTSQVSYTIIPQKNFRSEYLEGEGDQPCRQDKEQFSNPYDSSKPKICPLSIGYDHCVELLQKTALYPSVYAEWKLSVTGYESEQVPELEDDFKLKAAVTLCIRSSSGGSKKAKLMRNIGKKKEMVYNGAKKQLNYSVSCSKGEYWSMKSNSCITCSDASSDISECKDVPVADKK